MSEQPPRRKHPVHQPVYERGNTPVIIFVTVCAKDRKRVLANPEGHLVICQAWESAGNWLVGRYVIMPDHIHLFCAPLLLVPESLQSWMSFWKWNATRHWPHRGDLPIWQRHCWDTQLRRGEIVGFLGPSGCGKTSLFRIIAGLNKPTSGSVSLNGDARPVTPGEVGVVAQSYPLFDHRSVLSNLLLAAKQKERNTKAAREKVMGYLNEFDLADKFDLYPAQLSGGQRQRCAIIQQILCSDHFLLMDEPFSGLDLLMLEKTAELIAKVANMDELNTIIVVTHDVTSACSVADHIWLMGRESDSQGNKIPGSRIVKEFNLIDRDLCWHPGIMTTPEFVEFVREVKEEFRRL